MATDEMEKIQMALFASLLVPTHLHGVVIIFVVCLFIFIYFFFSFIFYLPMILYSFAVDGGTHPPLTLFGILMAEISYI